MRVAHVITRMIVGGAQENTLHNCFDLVTQYGDQVLLITGPSLGAEGQLMQHQQTADGLSIEVIDSLRRSIGYRDIIALGQLKRIIGQFAPDVVHTHSAKGGFLGRAAAWQCRVPAIVHTVHGAPFHPYQSRLARGVYTQLERWAAKRCHHLICVADAMTDLLVAASVAPRQKCTTVYSGMDTQPFQHCHQYRAQSRAQLGLTDSDILVGKIARLFHLKGHHDLIEAARRVIAQDRRVHFLLIGDGLLRSELQTLIAKYELQPHFHFTGLVAPERIPYYLSAMDLLVHTSLREGLARALPQALIAGLPVISYDVDGAREVVLTGQTGILVPPRSVDQLSTAILHLANDSQLRVQLGQGGADRFSCQFGHQHMTRQIREIYQKLLDTR